MKLKNDYLKIQQQYIDKLVSNRFNNTVLPHLILNPNTNEVLNLLDDLKPLKKDLN